MEKEFTVGQKVKVVAMPPYVKTAEPKPMLRPASVIAIGAEGIILDRRPGNYWGIRFEKGAFLLDSQYIEAVETSERSN
ncbi:MAG: DUF3148 domain-containing protein [Oscillatoriaceae cyanobacterium Prado104]|jgi:hypothetical protein|nr:DUF3148 domain-containing protein [Oscillatoriaceae cyanobacterium Prado104]